MAREYYFGSNYRPPHKKTPYIVFLFEALNDFVLKILLLCGFISIGLKMAFADKHHRRYAWISGFAVVVCVILVECFSAYNDYIKESEFKEIHNKN
jgi:hypothetical protein